MTDARAETSPYQAVLGDAVDGLHPRLLAYFRGMRILIPAVLAPQVTLTERFDDREQAQHVAVEVSAPLLGRIYEYAGSFRYEIIRGMVNSD